MNPVLIRVSPWEYCIRLHHISFGFNGRVIRTLTKTKHIIESLSAHDKRETYFSHHTLIFEYYQ